MKSPKSESTIANFLRCQSNAKIQKDEQNTERRKKEKYLYYWVLPSLATQSKDQRKLESDKQKQTKVVASRGSLPSNY